MDFYANKAPNSMGLIKGLFTIIMVSLLIGAILFFTLSIRETATISNGELFSENAPKQYLAPFEAEIKGLYMQEGGQVSMGDTLVVLYNDAIIADYNNLEKELALKERNNSLLRQQLDNLKARVEIQQKELSFVNTDASSQKRSLKLEIKGLAKQLNSLRKQLATSEIRYNKDRQLFNRGAISEQEFNRKEKAWFSEKNNFTQLESQFLQKKNTLDNLGNTKSSSIERKNLDIISSQSQQLDLEKTLAQEEGGILQLKQRLVSAKKEVDKLTIISGMNGFVSSVYNQKKDFNYVTKGQNLVVVSPEEELDFFAKLSIKETEMKDVEIGQKARLKVDAYNYYEFGVLEGEIIQINKDENNMFYVIAEITDNNEKFNLKSGYKVNGEIVLEKVKLYKFAFNRIFRKT